MNLSVVVLTKNEEDNIAKCLKSVVFADEIVIIDDYSTDKTIKVAEKFGAKIFLRHLNGDFSAQRNYGLEKAGCKWIFFLDADERAPQKLKVEVLNATQDLNVKGCRLVRRDFIFGKALKHGEYSKYGAFGNANILRLGRKGAGKWKRAVHEYWEISGRIKALESPILHYPHPSLAEFIKSINSFSTLHAKALRLEGKHPTLAKIVIWPCGKFVYNMIFRLGFLDGMQGFVVAILMSFNSFLAWSKAWIN